VSASSLKDIIEAARKRTVIIRAAGKRYRATLDDLTVLSDEADPFRLHTDARHRDGAWLADVWRKVGRAIHCRGLHYAAIGAAMPNGEKYLNTAKNWAWIQSAAAAARWLGYLDFDAITDERNAAPIFQEFRPPDPGSYITLGGVEVVIPDEITPDVVLDDFRGVQPYNLALFGEKTSLEPVLGPIAGDYGAHLLLPTGEASASMCNNLARIAAEDGRPLIIFYFSDSDPSGWQMAVSVARKFQALEAGFYPDLRWELRPVALTPEQVREYDLPSDPMKDGERRAAAWKAAYGVEQTEIDALATLQPDVLREIASRAISPFFDGSLTYRAQRIRREWEQWAREALVDQIGSEQLDQLRAEAEAKIAELEDEVAALNDAMRIPELDGVDLPPLPDLPEPEVQAENPSKAKRPPNFEPLVVGRSDPRADHP
jgi:hypothetical protein